MLGGVMGLVFHTLPAVEVTNVVDFFCFVDGREANLAKKEAAGMTPIEWTMAMGVEKNPKHREELKIMMVNDCGRRK